MRKHKCNALSAHGLELRLGILISHTYPSSTSSPKVLIFTDTFQVTRSESQKVLCMRWQKMQISALDFAT